MEILRADPAGNITILVLTPVEDRDERVRIARALLGDPSLGAEQAGFVLPPAAAGALPRLEMMGGEFCGNAARSFGLYLAGERRLRGRHSIPLEISGAEEPVLVEVDTEAGTASATMPLPLSMESLEYRGKSLPLVVFGGISHVVAGGIRADEKTFREIRALAEARRGASGPPEGEAPAAPLALGVMFWDEAALRAVPAVYVYGASSLVFESSCGSGTAALGCVLSRDIQDGEGRWSISQPGGVLELGVQKKAGKPERITIGGPVSLGEKLRRRCL
jgi:diaminopimelate epimerase